MRPALIAWGIALLIALQSLLSPLMASSAGRPQSADPVVSLAPFAPICHADAGDPAGNDDKAHHDCCVFCQSGGRDAAVILFIAVVTALLDTPKGPPSTAALAARDDSPPRASGWASSWSSRAPPFFS